MDRFCSADFDWLVLSDHDELDDKRGIWEYLARRDLSISEGFECYRERFWENPTMKATE